MRRRLDPIPVDDIQVVAQYIQPTGGVGGQPQGAATTGGSRREITIGEALEAAGQTIPGKPVDQCDAAAIQAAEVRATGSNVITPGGVAATAQSAAAYNESMIKDEDKVKLGDVLSVSNIFNISQCNKIRSIVSLIYLKDILKLKLILTYLGCY